MLRIPIDVIAELLDKAADVEITVFEVEEDESPDADGASEAAEEEDDGLAADPSYRELEQAIGEMSSDELHQLLTLAQLGAEETESSTWDEAAAEANAIPEADRSDELLRALILTDAIKTALAQLGYTLDEEDEEDEEDDDEDKDEDEDKAEA